MDDNMHLLAKNSELIAQIHEELPNLKSEFENIKSLRNQTVNDENFNSAINSVYQIFQYVPLLTSHLNSFDMPLFRARPNDQKNVLFSKETEISYNSTNKSVIRAGRFNGPNQAVFYASLPVDDGDINPSMAACLETCKGLTDQHYPVHLKDFTIGRWKIQSPFFVVNLCFDEEHLKGNRSLKHATEVYIKTIKDCLNKEASDFIISFFTYFSEMSGRKTPTKNEYYILTALFYAVKYYYQKSVNQIVYGLIYPSAMTEAKGLNVVLTTDAVDKYLRLDKVAMYRFMLDNQNTFYATPCSKAVDIKNGRFILLDHIWIPENKLYTIECESETGPLKEMK
ncbi:hypothetical protein SNE26_09040 [Mucilaginibacter sp. cycad4]|uniref:hypothetical protein n=1 Tax=Mucilaginibacter sp. cycad4 TaxID=3342096 RepID=UPI002AAABC4D|nr:hypothetical protein [Mucilaginibacter gossypii]WPV01917.1 hypothetical protein SNE26_09040 [Mucilaginibacter gossypii]